MLTFEKVMEVFSNYLKEDDECEVVVTRRGYTVMIWDTRANDWCFINHCNTPEELKSELLGNYESYLSWTMTLERRKLKDSEQELINSKSKELLKKFEAE